MRRNPIRLPHVPVPWVFVLGYLAGLGVEFAWRTRAPGPTLPVAAGVGAALLLIGVLVAGWGGDC